MTYLLAHAAIIRGERCLVRPAIDDEEGGYTLVIEDARIPVDHPSDMLVAVPDGETITIDYGRFMLALRRDEDAKPRYRAHVGDVVGPEDVDEERACWRLLDLVGDANAPRACFFCRWSEVEPSTGWGNMGCAVDHAEAYDAVATSTDPRRRKWGPGGMLAWVSEWHGCDRFVVRPIGYGYRGRPR